MRAQRNTVLLELAHGGVSAPNGKLLNDAPCEHWTLADALEGTQVFGATGSGKTSGSGATLARAFLDPERGNMGGIVLTAKPDEAELWRHYAMECGREADFVELQPAVPSTGFNFLAYEARHARHDGALAKELVSLFLTSLTSTANAASAVDPFWTDALAELLTHTIDLCLLAREELRLATLVEIVRSAPQSPRETTAAAWRRKSRCFRLITEAAEHTHEPERLADLEQTIAYWLRDFPNLSDRTRSVVVTSFTSKVAGLLRSPLRALFCETLTEHYEPEQTFDGKVIVVNLPVKTLGEVGRIAQIIYKTIWQRAAQRRRIGEGSRAVFLWADESQYFVTSDDMLFQQTARATRCATVYLTQNLPNYYAALGPGSGNAIAESLLGNFQTKIFHCNGDPVTNEWAERLFGRHRTRLRGNSVGSDSSFSSTEAVLPRVDASVFTTLSKGGERGDGTVDAIVFHGGARWRDLDGNRGDGRNFLRHSFRQGSFRGPN